LRAYQGHESVVFACGRRTLVMLRRSRHTHSPIVSHVGLFCDRIWIYVCLCRIIFAVCYRGVVVFRQWAMFVYRVQRFVEGATSGAALPDPVTRNSASPHNSIDNSQISHTSQKISSVRSRYMRSHSSSLRNGRHILFLPLKQQCTKTAIISLS
jgi:hypothetical protein